MVRPGHTVSKTRSGPQTIAVSIFDLFILSFYTDIDAGELQSGLGDNSIRLHRNIFGTFSLDIWD